MSRPRAKYSRRQGNNESQRGRSWLRCLVSAGSKTSDVSVLDALTPETVLRLDLIADQMLELGRTDNAVRAIRAAVIHGVK